VQDKTEVKTTLRLCFIVGLLRLKTAHTTRMNISIAPLCLTRMACYLIIKQKKKEYPRDSLPLRWHGPQNRFMDYFTMLINVALLMTNLSSCNERASINCFMSNDICNAQTKELTDSHLLYAMRVWPVSCCNKSPHIYCKATE